MNHSKSSQAKSDLGSHRKRKKENEEEKREQGEERREETTHFSPLITKRKNLSKKWMSFGFWKKRKECWKNWMK